VPTLGVTVSVREVPGPFVSGAGRWLKGVVMDRTVNRPPSWKFYSVSCELGLKETTGPNSRPRRGPKMRPKGAGGGVKWPFLGGAVLSYETHLPSFVAGW
jgi:hypothetical protein